MDMKSLLEQLLGGNNQGLNKQHNSRQTHGGLSQNIAEFASGRGGAALAGGALGLMLGSKSGRKLGGKALTYGGLAVFATLAYKAYKNHQDRSSQNSNHTNPVVPFEKLPAAETEKHCNAILVSLIAAAKADGHIDDRERELIDNEVNKITPDQNLQQWFDRELKKPLDPAEVAKHATGPAVAAEMYLASALVIDQQNFMEKTYLDELARQLDLPPQLQQELMKQAQEVAVNG